MIFALIFGFMWYISVKVRHNLIKFSEHIALVIRYQKLELSAPIISNSNMMNIVFLVSLTDFMVDIADIKQGIKQGISLKISGQNKLIRFKNEHNWFASFGDISYHSTRFYFLTILVVSEIHLRSNKARPYLFLLIVFAKWPYYAAAHTHTHINMLVCMYVCVFVCMCLAFIGAQRPKRLPAR